MYRGTIPPAPVRPLAPAPKTCSCCGHEQSFNDFFGVIYCDACFSEAFDIEPASEETLPAPLGYGPGEVCPNCGQERNCRYCE